MSPVGIPGASEPRYGIPPINARALRPLLYLMLIRVGFTSAVAKKFRMVETTPAPGRKEGGRCPDPMGSGCGTGRS